MSTITKFEDFEVWQKAKTLSENIYKLSNLPLFSKDYALKGQILRSSGSIMDNIAEGYERDGKKEFIQYLSIAKGSCGEFRSQLYRALSNEYIDKNNFDNLYNENINISKMLKGLIEYLKKSDIKGTKYKKST
jgi:four helix bundle protein